MIPALLLLQVTAAGDGGVLGPRSEIVHAGNSHESHLSGSALAVGKDGTAFVAWEAPERDTNQLYVARVGADPKPVRVNPDGLSVDSLHQPPALAVGPRGELYVSWSSSKPVPQGGLFASDLQLSRSLDGGRTFEKPLRVNEDRPISHSFEGLTVAPDGTVIVSWIDSREGSNKAGTYLARITDQGTRVGDVVKLDDTTCVCCRVALATGPAETVVAAWRRVFPGDIRDMVMAVSRDGAHSFAPAQRVHEDQWKINACPHRGGSVAVDDRGRVYVAWYTEGADGQPRMLFSVAGNGRRFSPAKQLNAAGGSVPDRVRLAVSREGVAVLVWEEATAVRRRVVMRYSRDGGRTLSASQSLSTAIKAYSPDVVPAPGGFMVSWQEEQFPRIKTVVAPLTLGAPSSKTRR